MINNFTRDISFFQSLFESSASISAKDFDNEFNDLINYFNKKIVFAINNIATKSYNGIVGNKNYILKNIGNGKVIFDSLKDTNFYNNTITFNKIIQGYPYSLLVVKREQGLFFTNTHNFTLGSKKIKGNSFYDDSILSNNIDANAIKAYHISSLGIDYLLSKLLLNNDLVNSNNLVNNTINNSKFTLYSITYEKLHSDIKSLRENPLTDLQYNDNCITINKIKDNSFDFKTISYNLGKFGKGVLSKNILPKNQILINIPDIQNPETIDTYALCSYSISNAFELKTYQQPRPDKIYINPLFIKYSDEYNDKYIKYTNSALTRDILYNSSVVNGVNAFSWALSNPTHGFRWFFESVLHVPTNTSDNIKIIERLNKNYAEYWNNRRAADNYQAECLRLSELIKNTPKNIYKPIPPEIYQVLEPVINTKSYIKHRNHDTIISKHLKNLSFNINNFLNRIDHPSIDTNKLIGVNCLSQNLKTKLGL